MQTLLAILAPYYLLACLFQAAALLFVFLDPRSGGYRPLWGLLTLFTGPIGLVAYLFKGRQ